MDSIQDYRKAEDHRKYAEECVTMALSSVQDDDKARNLQDLAWKHVRVQKKDTERQAFSIRAILQIVRPPRICEVARPRPVGKTIFQLRPDI